MFLKYLKFLKFLMNLQRLINHLYLLNLKCPLYLKYLLF
jgi:hypothetical protein